MEASSVISRASSSATAMSASSAGGASGVAVSIIAGPSLLAGFDLSPLLPGVAIANTITIISAAAPVIISCLFFIDFHFLLFLWRYLHFECLFRYLQRYCRHR